MTKYFGRVYELTVTTPGGVSRTFDGIPRADYEPLQIQFVVDQTPASHFSIAEITLTGINGQTEKDISERFSSVELRAGFLGNIATIFSGQIKNVDTGRNGPAPFVKMFCQSGAQTWQTAYSSFSFGENTPQKEIIRKVAETFGQSVTFIGNFDDLPPALKGDSVDADSKFKMNQLARAFDFEWQLTPGGMEIIKNDSERDDVQEFRYKATNGIIGVPDITEQGVDIDVLLNPRIRVGDNYTIESETNTLTFNGVYYQRRTFPKTNGESVNRVLSLVHEGDFYGDTWQTSLVGQRLA